MILQILATIIKGYFRWRRRHFSHPLFTPIFFLLKFSTLSRTFKYVAIHASMCNVCMCTDDEINRELFFAPFASCIRGNSAAAANATLRMSDLLVERKTRFWN